MSEHTKHGPGEEPDLGDVLEDLTADAKGYFEARKALLTLDISEKAGIAVGKIVLAVVATLLASMVLGMLALALGLYLGRVLNDSVLGFVAAAGIFLVLTLLFYALWRWVLRDRITLSIINAAHAKTEHLP